MPRTRAGSESTVTLADQVVREERDQRQLANSPGWIEKAPILIHRFAPLTSEMLAGRTAGIKHDADQAQGVRVTGDRLWFADHQQQHRG